MRLYKTLLFPTLVSAAPVDDTPRERLNGVTLITTVTTSYVMGTSLYDYTYTASISTQVPVPAMTTDVVVSGEAAMASASGYEKSDFVFPVTVTNEGGKDYTIQFRSTELDVPALTADYTFAAKETEISVPEHYQDVTTDGREVHLTIPAFNTTVHLDSQVVKASFTSTSSQRVVFTSIPFEDSDKAVKYFDLTLTVGLRQPAVIVTANPVTVPVNVPTTTANGVYGLLTTRTVSAITVQTFYEVPGTITLDGSSSSSSEEVAVTSTPEASPESSSSEAAKMTESPSPSPSPSPSSTVPTTSEHSTTTTAVSTESHARSTTEARRETETRASIAHQTENAGARNVAVMGAGFFGFLGMLLL